MDTRVYEMELGGNLLASVSRSFYLSMKVLPRSVRSVISLGYLLARATDTVADTVTSPVAARMANLEAFRAILAGTMRGGLPHLINPAHSGERLLLKRLPECLNWFELISEADRADIRAVLQEIIRGQELDLQRFAEPGRAVALKSPEELEEYTYLVAGCVGRFWTRVCLRHLANYSSMSPEELCRLGVNFGKGLQLVNILRDLPADLRAGRCYLPIASDPLLAQTPPEALLDNPLLARPLFEHWLGKADAWIADGGRYIHAINPFRVRYACILPWRIGVQTLARLRQTPPLENAARIKVPRSEVRILMLKAIPAAFSNAGLRGWLAIPPTL